MAAGRFSARRSTSRRARPTSPRTTRQTGHYSATGEYFANAGVDAPPLHALSNATALNGVYLYGSGGFPTESFNASNYWVDVIFSTFVGEGDTTPPAVTAVTPASGATGVGTGINPTITFSEPIAPATISTSTIELRNAANALVAGSVSYDAATRTRQLRSRLGARVPVDLYHPRQGRHERPARDGSHR